MSTNMFAPLSVPPALDRQESKDASHDVGDLDADIAAFLNLGLKLADIERLWAKVPGIDLGVVHAVGARLLEGTSPAGQRAKVTLARQASLGLELLGGESKGAALDSAVERLRAELEDPPAAFQDPVMLTLMKDPMVLSSGFVFDRSTIFDANGNNRFDRCPMSRQSVKRAAYPLVQLKSQLTEFRLKRLDQILLVAQDKELDVWHYAWETHFSAAAPADLSCARNRGASGNPLFVLNHFLTNPVAHPSLAQSVNFNPFLEQRARLCQNQSGALPNFVTVDFEDVGDVHTVVAALNRV